VIEGEVYVKFKVYVQFFIRFEVLQSILVLIVLLRHSYGVCLDGLSYAWSMGFRLVELDVDSVAVVKVIKTGVTTSVAGGSLIKNTGRLLEQG
jgi:hypothetical protein